MVTVLKYDINIHLHEMFCSFLLEEYIMAGWGVIWRPGTFFASLMGDEIWNVRYNSQVVLFEWQSVGL